ncbi:Alpha-(1,3)-fucosyltransferase 7 [Sparganum proliferum]
MNIGGGRQKVLSTGLHAAVLLFYAYYAVLFAKLVQHAAPSPVNSLLQERFRRTVPALDQILLEEDLRQAQEEEWRKPPDRRHCPSGIFYPLMRVFTQTALFTREQAQQDPKTAEVQKPVVPKTAPLIFIDQRFYFPLDAKEECRFVCRSTTNLRRAHNASAAVFTRNPTSAMAKILKRAIWAFHSMESPLRMHEVHPDYKSRFSIFLTSNPNSTIPSVYGAFEAFKQPECLIGADVRRRMELQDNRRWLPSNFKQKSRLVAWVVSNMNAENHRKLIAARLRRWIPIDIYGANRLHCPGEDCHAKLGQMYKFYLAFENSNCRGYLTEKIFRDALGAGMVPIVIGGSPEDYYSIAPPNSYIHIGQFPTLGKLAEYIRYLAQNDTAYSAYFAWKALGTLKGAPVMCRICGFVHKILNRELSLPLNQFAHHTEPMELCSHSERWLT